MDVTTRQRTPFIKSLAAMLIAVAIFFALLFFWVDHTCYRSISRWMPAYPDAKLISDEHNFFRSQGMGLTVITLGTEDDTETVRQFYRDNNLAMMRAGVGRGLASFDWRVVEDPDNVGGSLIYLYSECGQN